MSIVTSNERELILSKAKELVRANLLKLNEYKSLNVILSSGRLSRAMLASVCERFGIEYDRR